MMVMQAWYSHSHLNKNDSYFRSQFFAYVDVSKEEEKKIFFFFLNFLTERKSIGSLAIRLQTTTCESTRELWRLNNPFIFALTSVDEIVNTLCFDDEDEDRDEVDVDNWK